MLTRLNAPALLALLALAILLPPAHADAIRQTKAPFEDRFRQLEGEAWPTPTDYRNAATAVPKARSIVSISADTPGSTWVGATRTRTCA